VSRTVHYYDTKGPLLDYPSWLKRHDLIDTALTRQRYDVYAASWHLNHEVTPE
jgi:hypothetical protein